MEGDVMGCYEDRFWSHAPPPVAPGPALGVKVEQQGSAADRTRPQHWFAVGGVTVCFSQHTISQITVFLQKVEVPFLLFQRDRQQYRSIALKYSFILPLTL